MQLKTQLDDARQQLQTSKNAHLRNIEMMEVNTKLKLDSITVNVNICNVFNKVYYFVE